MSGHHFEMFFNQKITARNMFLSQQRMVKVVAAAKPLRASEVLKADNLLVEDWPSSTTLTGAFKTVEEVRSDEMVYQDATAPHSNKALFEF
jgi:Flp pilus assembly protein CpaB